MVSITCSRSPHSHLPIVSAPLLSPPLPLCPPLSTSPLSHSVPLLPPITPHCLSIHLLLLCWPPGCHHCSSCDPRTVVREAGWVVCRTPLCCWWCQLTVVPNCSSMCLLVVGTIHPPCEQVLAALWRVGVCLHWDVFPQSCVEADRVGLAVT
jgi:hypothetical protein